MKKKISVLLCSILVFALLLGLMPAGSVYAGDDLEEASASVQEDGAPAETDGEGEKENNGDPAGTGNVSAPAADNDTNENEAPAESGGKDPASEAGSPAAPKEKAEDGKAGSAADNADQQKEDPEEMHTAESPEDEFIAAVAEGGSVSLGADITLSEDLSFEKATTLDLNGHTLNAAGKTLFILSKTTIKDSSSGESGKITGKAEYLIQVGNSSAQGELTVESGTIESSKCAVSVTAAGKLTINGGTLTGGSSALMVGAGKVTVTDGTIKGNEDSFDTDPIEEGGSAVGSAIFICPVESEQPVEIKISGGEFHGYLPVYEANLLDRPQEELDKITYDISDGKFYSAGDKTVQISDLPNGKFITGGEYTHKVTDYVKDGYFELRNDTDTLWRVAKKLAVKLTVGDNGTASLSSDTKGADVETIVEGSVKTLSPVASGNKITVSASPKSGYEVDKIICTTKSGKETDMGTARRFIMPKSDVSVNVTFKKKAADNSGSTPAPTADTTEKGVYRVVSGGNVIWVRGSTKNYTLTVKRGSDDASCFSHFTGVMIDGKALEKDKDYTAVAGSTVVTIKTTAMQALADGEHKVTVNFDDGSAEAKLAIRASANSSTSAAGRASSTSSKKSTSAKTGDDSDMAFWIFLMIFACATAMSVFVTERRMEEGLR